MEIPSYLEQIGLSQFHTKEKKKERVGYFFFKLMIFHVFHVYTNCHTTYLVYYIMVRPDVSNYCSL